MKQAGIVYLVSAGPGNPDLLTVRGKELLQQAEVVVYDRLAGEEILSLAPGNALLIDVGKTSGNHPVPQEKINRILVEQAQAGKKVVRLKGGDSFVFGRGGEELERLHQAGIPFEVVPGVTSAIAAPAFAGIPVTHRDYCASLHIITGHRRQNGALELDYGALVRLKGTLVFLMAVATVGEIAAGLCRAGMEKTTPCALIENGTRPEQRKLLSTLETVAEDVLREKIQSPAVFVVGGVCGLSDDFDWFSRLPLKGLRFLVTSPRATASRMAEGLRRLGARVLCAPAVKTVPIPFAAPDLSPYTAVIFTSAFGVSSFFAALFSQGTDARCFAGKRIFCVGKETANALLSYGLRADYVPDRYSGEALAGELLEKQVISNKDSLLWLRAEAASPALREILRGAGIPLAELAVYRTEEQPGAMPLDFDYAVFTSASCVERFCAKAGPAYCCGRVKALCIGEQTARAARNAGMEPFVSPVSSIPGMLEWIQVLCAGTKKEKERCDRS